MSHETAGAVHPHYTAEHVREALAQDQRVGELGLQVRMDGEVVEVSGDVTTEDRRVAVSDVARRAAPGAEVRNVVRVVPHAAEPEVERLP